MVKNKNGGEFMPIKVDIQTNINDNELTIESCSQIIMILQDAYKNLRGEMYNHFLGIHQLKKAVIVASVVDLIYMISQDIFFLYLVPVSILLSLIAGLISAEFLTTQTRKQILIQIEHFKKLRDKLVLTQDLNI